MSRREEVIQLLEDNNIGGLIAYAKKDPGLFRTLISLAYDKQTVLGWRAIEAMGVAVGETAKANPEKARNLAQRLLWMLREESGNNPWSAPDMLGEIVRNCPEDFADFAPIIASFHDEEILHQGVLRAMVRIGEVRPELVRDQAELARTYLCHRDPLVRAYAIQLAGILCRDDLREALALLLQDETEVLLYTDGEFVPRLIRTLAAVAIGQKAAPEKKGWMKHPEKKGTGLRCPFCEEPVGALQEITARFGNTFTGGKCSCGAVFVYDGSGHNLGDAYVDGLAYACDNDFDKAWSLVPEEDYEIRELCADTRRNKFLTARRGTKCTYLFIRLTEGTKPDKSPDTGQ
ncbi:MAG: hypothetical protein C0402_01810 [Thermodesulfovibrio sp.]|nr:hypothetical protein [Thermodesulfovibrio sp.]